jgi:phospho-N-acetylmuramoyl-pentapeptide-transferase
MGGIMFMAAALVCVVIGGWTAVMAGTYEHLMVLGFSLVFGAIGFVDDFVKVKKKRNLGLTAKQKLVLQLAAALAYLRA